MYGASLRREGGEMCGVGVSVASPCMCRVPTCGIRDESGTLACGKYFLAIGWVKEWQEWGLYVGMFMGGGITL